MIKPEHKVGDVIDFEGEKATIVHITPAIDETCDHDWAEDEDHEPTHCLKCGLSFTRYIFCCCP